MKAITIEMGRNPVQSENKLQLLLFNMEKNNQEVKHVASVGLSLVIFYEEKKLVKGLTKQSDNGSIKERTGKTKEVPSDNQVTTNHRKRSKTSKGTKGNR